MALQGTIKDFALPDIFQLIGMQRKTGILSLESGADAVTIKFLEGQVVGADAQSISIEDRLGEVLVRTGRITQAQLDEALRAQQNTLQRLGHILVRSRHISEDELVEALRVQSSQIIYRLFRWHEGNYKFRPVSDLEYDQAHFVPISSETILMEGARMIDEWPIIERRIKSDRMVLRKTESAQRLAPEVESILDHDIDFQLGEELDRDPASAPDAEAASPEVSVSGEERVVLNLVDGNRCVSEICDLSTMGEFDTCRILSEMLTRNLVEPVDVTRQEVEASRLAAWFERLGTWVTVLALALVCVGALSSLRGNPWTPWRQLARSAATDQLKLYASMARLERVENAIQVFYLDTGAIPRSTTVLAQSGFLSPEDLSDPWGRPYQLQLSGGGYLLVGLGADGEVAPELTVSRRFNTVQRMMLDEEERTPEP